MNLRSLTLLAAVLLVAACASNQEKQGAATGTGGQQTPPATAAGPTPGTEQDLAQNVGDRVFFDFDKSDIKSEERMKLQKQAEWLKKYPNVTVTIAGNCDDRGTREYNLALGERRASAAKKVLVALGVPANRISTISYGKERPSVPGDNEAAWAQNRNAITSVN
ncbi:MAG TPA: peptidoglycan-associated lipoprotein Pal [Stellaceae bacterium]|jgi:peptidoglycan-associated lipoprotein|nr:peptidoglycan-associated lipoprotein Pal [Stellaceae bacterium]